MIRSLVNYSGFYLLTVAFLPLHLSAAVVERDWKTPGDGLMTLDTVNKREWLDLSQTLLSDQFPGTGSDFLEIREARYQYVVAQTAPGGIYDEFTLAKSADVIALAQSAGIDTSTPDHATNSDPTFALTNLIGLTFESDSGGLVESIGLLDELSDMPFFHRVSARFRVRTDLAGLQLGSAHTQSLNFPPGVFLYRTIPEPATWMLCLTNLVIISALGRHRSRCAGY